MQPAILSGSMALPLGSIDAHAVRAAQTHRYFQLGEEEATEVISYREDGGYLYVPRQYGIAFCRRNGIEYVDETSQGIPLVFPRMPDPRDYQVPVLDEIEGAMGDFYDFVFRARTGFGKTISSLLSAARFGKSVMILVDQENLKDQWVGDLQKHFGMALKDIGIIQGKTCTAVGKMVSVGMIQTLAQKRMSDEVYKSAGLLLVDEVHTAGAPTFSTVLMDFHATCRMGVSATPKRKDGLQKLLDYNLGKVRVYVADAHKRSSVYIRYSPTVYSWYANSSPKAGRYLSEVTEDGARNLAVAEAATMVYESGRDTLVLSDRIDQLQHLMNLCYYLGVPKESMGMYTGQDFTLAYEKEVTPPRRPEGWVRGTEYTPVNLKLISKKVPKARLKEVKASAALIFATYQMFAKGVDVPRLAGGVDASPRSQAEQMQGRILRELEGKKESLWITIADENSYRSLHQLQMRLADYETNNSALFHLHDDGSVTPCHPDDLKYDLKHRVAELKSARIETLSVGLHTLAFPESPTLPVRKVVSSTRPTPRPRGGLQTVSSPTARNVRSPLKGPRILPLSSRSPSRRRP